MSDLLPTELELVPTSELRGADYNPRHMPDEAMAALMRSIERWGFTQAVIVNRRSGLIVGGHQRVEAAKRLGLGEVPVLWVSLDEGDEMALNLALNKISGEWDTDKLKLVMRELKLTGFDLALTGFTQPEILSLTALELPPKEGLTGDDETARIDRSEPAKTKPGDVIRMGPHVLVCGDATDPEIVRLLFRGGEKARGYLTDPPYNVAMGVGETPEQAKKRNRRTDGDTIANDALDPAAFRVLLAGIFNAATEHLEPGSGFYVFHSDVEVRAFADTLEAAGLPYRQIPVWVKNALVMGRKDHHYQHEPILYGWKAGAAHRWYGGWDKSTVLEHLSGVAPAPRDLSKLKKYELLEIVETLLSNLEGTVIRHDKPSSSEAHPSAKPVGLIERLLLNITAPGDLVLDTCAGYGSLLIAAEKHRRIARLAELDPWRCDAIVARWEGWTGDEAQR